MSAKSAVKSAALSCGTAAFAVDFAVEAGVLDELHAETTSPNESTALVIAMDLRPVPIDLPSVDEASSTAQGRIAYILSLIRSRTGSRYQTVTRKTIRENQALLLQYDQWDRKPSESNRTRPFARVGCQEAGIESLITFGL